MSSSRPFALLACLIVSIVAVAGCLGGQPANANFVATGMASGSEPGHYMTSWDYAAADLHPLRGTLRIDVDETTNTGFISAEGAAHTESYSFALTNFNHSADDFHSGGIAANFLEHGDSGVGNTLLPAMNLLLATWGTGTLTMEGTDVVDPYTGNTTWATHVMVTNTGVRKDGHGGVFKADGVTPYDPATPGDATVGSDNEAHVVFSSRAPAANLVPLNMTWQALVNPVTGPQSTAIPLTATGGTFVIEIDLGIQPYEVTGLTFDLIDPTGAVRETLTATSNTPQRTMEKTASTGTIGDWTLRATAEAIPTDFDATITVTYPPYPMHYFVWESVDIAKRVVTG